MCVCLASFVVVLNCASSRETDSPRVWECVGGEPRFSVASLAIIVRRFNPSPIARECRRRLRRMVSITYIHTHTSPPFAVAPCIKISLSGGPRVHAYKAVRLANASASVLRRSPPSHSPFPSPFLFRPSSSSSMYCVGQAQKQSLSLHTRSSVAFVSRKENLPP